MFTGSFLSLHNHLQVKIHSKYVIHKEGGAFDEVDFHVTN